MPKVIVGMSGGVDSSVTAYLLKQKGFDVEGISFRLWEARNRADSTMCCSLEAQQSAARTANQIGVSHDTVDVRDEFIEKVIDPFVEAYTMGLTPNPCILCNMHIKFPFLLQEADRRGAEFIATGHYARVVHGHGNASSVPLLLKGVDQGKDQSYVLYVLSKEILGRLILPLGDFRKDDVRSLAKSLHLDAADRPESQEICFIEDRDYCRFIQILSPETVKEGPIKDIHGTVLGTHKGICSYTIGQRKGLGISSPEPYYVTRIDAQSNTVYVGSQEDTKIREFRAGNINWIMQPKEGEFRATVKVRSMMPDKPALITREDGNARVMFDEPQWAPAPGQSAVFYDGDAVTGGGVILGSEN